MDMKKAKEKLKKIEELRFYGVYIDQSLAGDFSQDICFYIEKLQAENEELIRALELKHPVLDHMEQEINKIKADAITEAANTLCIRGDSVLPVNYTQLLKYANNLEDKQ